MTSPSTRLFVLINLPKKFVHRLALTVLLLCVGSNAARPDESGLKPWLLAFPEIAADSQNVYFSNTEWIGYYSAPRGLMYTIPRDTLEIPPPLLPSDSAFINSSLYTAGGATITRIHRSSKPAVYKPPQPSAEEVKRLSVQLGDTERRMASVVETIHPLTVYQGRMWFGLELSDSAACVCTAGIGWFDPKRKRFGKIYDSTLAGCRPKWIGVAADTVNMLVVNNSHGELPPKLVRYSINSKTWSELDLRDLGLPDENLRSAAVWGDTLLLATDATVIIWPSVRRSTLWNTRMYAARSPVPLYLVTFDSDSVTMRDSVCFQTLGASKLSPVAAWIGDWTEIVTAEGFTGIVNDADWRTHQKRWADFNWNCGDTLCFARVHVPHYDSLVEGDFINIPISYVGKSDNGIRVQIRAAWARREDLLPVLMPL